MPFLVLSGPPAGRGVPRGRVRLVCPPVPCTIIASRRRVTPHHLRDRPGKGPLLARHATRAGLALHWPRMEPRGLALCTDALTRHPLSSRVLVGSRASGPGGGRWSRRLLVRRAAPHPGRRLGPTRHALPSASWAAIHATGDDRCMPSPLYVCSGVPRLTRLLAGAPKAHSSAALPPSGLGCGSSGRPGCMACETSAGTPLGAGTPSRLMGILAACLISGSLLGAP